MSSSKAQLEVNGSKYKVLLANYGFAQKVDVENKPSTLTKGGMMNVTIEATKSTEFVEKAVSNEQFGAVKLTYFNNDNSVMKEVNLTDVYLVGYKENYNAESADTMTEELIFTAREIAIGNAVHVNNWTGSFAS